jgi:endonuclease/exonuclease/phosphatase family metal-dependent hydrolase
MIGSPRLFRFLLLLSFGLAGVPSLLAQKIRIVAGNISSGNGQNYNEGHGIRIFQGLKPDIVLIQEFNYLSKSPADMRAFVDTAFGAGFSYFRESNTGSIPNGVISRFPILESGQWVSTVAERDYAWARIDLPGSRELLAISVHLPTTDSAQPGEALDLVGYVDTYYAANGGSRASDYLVIGGDFNTDSRTATCLNSSHLGQIITVGTSHPADRNGNVNTNAGRNKPYDGVYAGKGLPALQVPTVIGGSTFTYGLVGDTRVYSPLSEIAPALSGDSGAAQMQHMAVVKDFLIPLPADPPVLTILSSSIKTTAPRHAQISLQATTGATYEVQATNTMGTSAWSNLGTFIAGSTTAAVTIVTTTPTAGQVQDPLLATAVRRFYRIIRR